ncbi:uncharacterized protein RJT20DRAFT_10275 [Scheffersomyces xylosifermentans]|uniref:uncharacterized protein n=1 Tax=Scheffersomyces xylosifermentans TaxID=1304137 RepID=UPI00315D2879
MSTTQATQAGVVDSSSSSAAGDGDGNAKNFSRTPTSWDAEDDILLMHLKDQQKLGWKEIASHFTNRTPNACQFRWRRLKSGNLKNPPKSAAALGTQIKSTPPAAKKPKKLGDIKTDGSPSGFQPAYSPIANATFTGYDNNISNALAGLNALSNTPSNISSPLPNYQIPSQTNPSTPGVNSPGLNNQNNNHLNHTTYENSPKSEVSLDPQSHNQAPGTGGGYYADISIDPTMNLPHNQAHPHTPTSITPRNSTSNSSTNATNNTSSSATAHTIHNNSIIQIARDDRNSVSSMRASVSSLPSKSMNIPHHQSNNSALAHLPILFGGAGGSVSGPSRNSSISGAPGIQQTTVSSLRNGSVVGSSSGYYSRSGSVVIPYSADKKEEEPLKIEKKKTEPKKKTLLTKRKLKSSKSSTPVLQIPWSMEEDELLINRRRKELSFAELSILLPQRTEGEIWERIDYLENLRNGHRSTNSRDSRRRQSSLGIDVMDDFYDDDEDVIGGIDVSDNDDDDDDVDDVLVDVDDSITGTRKKRKRRASSAVNPLTVSESIRKRVR